MQEVVGDLWVYPATVRCITTQGDRKGHSTLIMGAGCAREAKERYPILAALWGDLVTRFGNWPFVASPAAWPELDMPMVSFPTKHSYHDRYSDIELIVRSATRLVWIIDRDFPGPATVVVVPRPGCGMGGLSWPIVKEALDPILDDRFHIITPTND